MELRHLRYFVAVADELHFGRAAQRLFMAQPPLSQQIRQLEEELEVELFARTSRKVELTDAGHAFLKEARSILAQVEQAKLLAQRTARGEVGELSLGFTNSAAFELLPRLLSAYRERYPHIHVTLQELKRDEQINALHAGRVQVGILRPMVTSAELSSEIIQREPLLLVLPVHHPLVQQEHIAMQDLAKETFVMLPRYWSSTFYDQIISLCYSAGFSPEVAQEAAEIHTIVGLVAANIGISLVPASTQFLRSRGVVYRHLQGDTSEIEMALAWRHDDRSPVVHAFINLAREEMRTYTPDYEIN
ncbi:MAG: LysR substrate-binding domain-containing protein [Ktedonobacteraceae bacterium]